MKARRTATATTAYHALRYARSRGVDVAELARRHDLTAFVDDVSFAARVPVETLYDLWESVVAATGRDAPFAAAEIGLSELRSPLAVLSAGASTVAEALATLEKFFPSVTDDYTFVREENARGILFIARVDGRSRAGKCYDVEFALADLAVGGRRATDGRLTYEEAWLPRSLEGGTATAERIFAAPLRLDTGCAALLLSARQLRERLLVQPRVVIEAMSRSAEENLRVRPCVHERVAAWLDQHLARGRSVTLADAARACGMSSRTLSRELASEETSFTALLDLARKRACLEWVHRTTDEVLARRLGFANVITFRRAFRRWTQSTPNAYRRSG